MSNTDAGKAKILAWLKASDPKTVGEALVEDATTDVRGRPAGDRHAGHRRSMRLAHAQARR